MLGFNQAYEKAFEFAGDLELRLLRDEEMVRLGKPHHRRLEVDSMTVQRLKAIAMLVRLSGRYMAAVEGLYSGEMTESAFTDVLHVITRDAEKEVQSIEGVLIHA